MRAVTVYVAVTAVPALLTLQIIAQCDVDTVGVLTAVDDEVTVLTSGQ